ncbi:response regulator [Thiofilum flexile]|uniref:response regulator n=1 Tax=Thiofilum flexile TaxID=125627 RepID=UPI000374C775|nr:response regulator [Thiofilum flexile]
MSQALSILLLEDETTYAQLIELFLLDHNYQVQKAHSLAEARNLLQQHFDVIITDMNLPDGDGVQFINSVRQQWPDIAVIFMTGFLKKTETLNNLFSKNKIIFLQKPFSLNQLLEEIALLTLSSF